MQIDVTLRGAESTDAADQARRAAEVGFDGVYFTESTSDPFISCALAAGECPASRIGTGIALAFPRSPLDVAYSSWDLARLSGGRFALGLGSQVKPHIVRRYSAVWDSPAPRMADFVRAVKAIWHAWESGEKLSYEGRFYSHTLMPPNFTPRPLGGPPPKVLLGGVREKMLATIGEVGDGVMCHSLQTPEVLEAFTIPALADGATRAGRQVSELEIGAGVFAAVSEERWETIRARIGFYASTPGYRHVLDHHGLGDLHEALLDLSRNNGWAKMAALVTDEVMDLFVVDASDPEVGAAEIKRRWGRADRIGLDPGDRAEPEEWAPLVEALKAG